MDLPSTLAARRICYLAGRPFWARAISIGGLAEVVAWLDDMTPGDRDMPPKLSDPASQALIASPPGRALLAWIALRDEGVGYEQAATLWHDATDDERARLLSVLFGRRRSLRAEAGGDDIGVTWCGKGFAQAMAEFGVEAFRALTLDQLEFLFSEGECDRHADPGHRALLEAQRLWEERRAAKKVSDEGDKG